MSPSTRASIHEYKRSNPHSLPPYERLSRARALSLSLSLARSLRFILIHIQSFRSQQAAIDQKAASFDAVGAETTVQSLLEQQRLTEGEMHQLSETIRILNQSASEQATVAAKESELLRKKQEYHQAYGAISPCAER